MMGEILGALYLLCMMFCVGILFKETLSSGNHWFLKILLILFGLLLVPLGPFILGFGWADSNASKLSYLKSLDERLDAISKKLHDRT
jgi:hypothetical protein